MSLFDLAPGPASGPLTLRYDRPVAVLGDVHGRADLLTRLLRELPRDIPLLITGDVGDRGYHTSTVVQLLAERDACGVLGNHDVWLANWAAGRGFDPSALLPVMGGLATLASYRVSCNTVGEVDGQAGRVPEHHTDWLESLAAVVDLHVEGEPFWLVHAGAPPAIVPEGMPPDEILPHLLLYSPTSLMWPRTEPVRVPNVGRTLVMGHMPRPEPLDLGQVIAIDTGAGAYTPGRLTAVILPERRFVTVG